MGMRLDLADLFTDREADHGAVEAAVMELEGARDVDTLRSCLQGMAALLKRHFSQEQRPGGLYDRMGANRPEHDETLVQLIGDHASIQDAANELVREAGAQSGVDVDHLRRGVEDLVARIRRHEDAEVALAVKIFRGE